MAEDLLEKGAIMQRDKETYAIAPHIPGGIITDFNLLRRLADAAEKYGVKAIKLTSAERFALVGLKAADLDEVWRELGLTPGAAIGLCVRSIKICPGTTFCRLGVQDAVGLGLLDRRAGGLLGTVEGGLVVAALLIALSAVAGPGHAILGGCRSLELLARARALAGAPDVAAPPPAPEAEPEHRAPSARSPDAQTL